MGLVLFAGAATWAVCAPARAAVINVGNILLAADTAGQTRQFFVTGAEQVGGLEFDIQVGDGGSAFGGVDTGPRITAIDLKTGTIFGASSNQADTASFPLARQSTVDLNVGTVLDNGLIATVTFDTTGILTPLTRNLLLKGVAGSFNTHFVDGTLANNVPTTIIDGTVAVVVPEPAPAALTGVLVAAGLLKRRGWRAFSLPFRSFDCEERLSGP
jgi:hypothetical protein